MKTRKITLAITCLLLVSVSLFSAGNEILTKYPSSIGAQIGQLSGYGLSYQKRISDLDALQTTVGLSFNGDATWGSYLDYVVGVEYQHTIYSDCYDDWFLGQLYIFTAINHMGSIETVDEYSDVLGPFKPSLAVGGGFGVEILFFDHFSLPIEFGYGAFWEYADTSFIKQLQLQFIAQVGMRYRF
ncbi:hypothetical protein SpiGrapes_0969 [Sphaerochaeta pleomorpha str. Grapes]|uniref:Outer membrane protein beta-barrel domain-containing protein n=1 Tax=Sphaerochaeta pleomorpha (strain ATCC BAA-1885 / DSM 22778 / Grapes) TaxID=158190 RepID=G8QRE1_SPHPG|nr:hypothetical protein [Sphaerochaeta pleomorpha]AEV28794.1 hypothetical protein SpiGrapes_0969 [Sphaerochaeta pleomorpha str. Grapes]